MKFKEWLISGTIHEKLESIMCFIGFHVWEKETFSEVHEMGYNNKASLRLWNRRCRHCKKTQSKYEAIVESKWRE